MTVGVCVASAAGVALVTDSRRMAETAGQEPRLEVVSDEARKLFVIDDRLVVATHGQAVIGDETIGSLMGKFDGPTTNGGATYATALGEFFSRRMSSATTFERGDLLKAEKMRWPLGFVVAGIDGDVGHLYGVRVRAGDFHVELLPPSTENPGVHTFGLSDGIDRLLNGVDMRALDEAGISLAENEREKLAFLAYDLTVSLELEELIEFAESLVGVQLLAERFSWGTFANKENRVKGCGGPLRTATVTNDGASLVRRVRTNPEADRYGAHLRDDAAPAPARRSA